MNNIVNVSNEAKKFIDGLHMENKKKILKEIRKLREDSDIGKELIDNLKGLRSLRVGKYRILYRVGKKEVEVIAVGYRRDIYKRFTRS